MAGKNLNGENRAYPFQILVWHEIVNDIVGNKPVAIPSCPSIHIPSFFIQIILLTVYIILIFKNSIYVFMLKTNFLKKY